MCLCQSQLQPASRPRHGGRSGRAGAPHSCRLPLARAFLLVAHARAAPFAARHRMLDHNLRAGAALQKVVSDLPPTCVWRWARGGGARRTDRSPQGDRSGWQSDEQLALPGPGSRRARERERVTVVNRSFARRGGSPPGKTLANSLRATSQRDAPAMHGSTRRTWSGLSLAGKVPPAGTTVGPRRHPRLRPFRSRERCSLRYGCRDLSSP